MILERLGKCVEALEVIRGPLGGRLRSSFMFPHECLCFLNTVVLLPINLISY